MYSKSSNALKNEYYTHKRTGKSEVKKNSAPNVKRGGKKAKAAVLRKQKMVASVMMLAIMAFTVLFRYAAIAREFSSLTEMKNELNLINAQVVEKEIEAGGNVDPKRIESEAERLGLHQPTEDQKVYISLGNTDNGEILKNETPGVMSAFISRISVILEYLY